MNSKFTQSWALPPTWLRFLIIVLLLLGVFFRFVNLDRKVYWGDETYTSLRLSGYTQTEMLQQVFNGKVISIEDLQKYQRPQSETGLSGTLRSLAIEDTMHPPLYFMLLRFWVQWWGEEVAVTRSLSVIISLLVFPAVYWLSSELFGSSLVGWVAIALLAVSPFHLLYAQEAREYSLWTLTILLSSAALLRAIKRPSRFSWFIYAATVALALYSYLFSVLVFIGHGIYVAVIERFKLNKAFIAYLLASLAGFFAFAPWLVILISNLQKVYSFTDWSSTEVSRQYVIKMWAVNLSRAFFDVQFGTDDPFNLQLGYTSPLTYIILFNLILVGYSIYFLWRQTPQFVWLFVFTLIGVSSLPHMLPALVSGSWRSLIPRYFTPGYLGVQLAVAYLLATKITAMPFKSWHQKLWQFVLITLISGGIVSCVLISQAETWWIKYSDYYHPQVARIINQASRPLVISDSSQSRVMSLSYLLNPKVQFLLNPQNLTPEMLNPFSDVFVFQVKSAPLFTALPDEVFQVKNYKTELIYKNKLVFINRKIYLWQMTKV